MKKRARAASAPTRPSAGGARPRPASPVPTRVAVDLAATHPALIAAALVAALAVLVSVTTRITDSDIWQHLFVGRWIWQSHAIPMRHISSWLHYGEPEVVPSWGFRALVWPFFAIGGEVGLHVWRWLTTLVAFGLLCATARRMGARGFLPLVILVWSSLIYRQRSQVRPETIAAVLFCLELWILETRRQGGPNRLVWLIGIAWVWINLHISYFLGFVLFAIYAIDELLSSWRRRRAHVASATTSNVGRWRGWRPWLWIALGMLAISFVNPFGWRALWQPFEYGFQLRGEPMYRGIGELQPLGWQGNESNGIWLLVFLWPVLLLTRVRRSGWDWVELLLCAFFTAYSLPSQRFTALYALVAAPFVARDLGEWLVRARRSGPASPWGRAALTGTACVAIGLWEWSNPALPLGIGIDYARYPVGACDFIARHGIGGREFGPFRFAGYLLWRFSPDRARLPFMDIHQTGTAEERRVYTDVFTNGANWPPVADRYAIDWVLLDPRHFGQDPLADWLDRDSSWSLVFVDDAGALFVRRGGKLQAVADSFALPHVAAGAEKAQALLVSAADNDALRDSIRTELTAMSERSKWNSGIRDRLAYLAMADGDAQEARRQLQLGLATNPRLPHAHERLGMIALAERRPAVALEELLRERAVAGESARLEVLLGMATRQTGDPIGARRHLERALKLDPGSQEAAEELRTLSESSKR
jgi:hypothetical protein